MTDITEFDEKELVKSFTYLKWKGEYGRCAVCDEIVQVLYPCCSGSVNFEGSTFDSDIIWDKIENELIRRAEPDLDAERKDLEK